MLYSCACLTKSVCLVIRLWAALSLFRIPVGQDVFSSPNLPDRLLVPAASCPIDIKIIYPAVMVPRSEVDQLPLYSVGVELYISSHCRLSWRRQGNFTFFYLLKKLKHLSLMVRLRNVKTSLDGAD
jgi:hypothetical protein